MNSFQNFNICKNVASLQKCDLFTGYLLQEIVQECENMVCGPVAEIWPFYSILCSLQECGLFTETRPLYRNMTSLHICEYGISFQGFYLKVSSPKFGHCRNSAFFFKGMTSLRWYDLSVEMRRLYHQKKKVSLQKHCLFIRLWAL